MHINSVSYISFDLRGHAWIYVALDNRQTTRPSFMEDISSGAWSYTGYTLNRAKPIAVSGIGGERMASGSTLVLRNLDVAYAIERNMESRSYRMSISMKGAKAGLFILELSRE